MTNTALGAGAEKAQEIIFISEAHEKFYYEKLKEVRYQDVYHKAFCYCLGISDDTRRNANHIYDFKTGCVKTECLQEGWQTSGSVKVVRMAFNLYCNATPSVDDYMRIGDFKQYAGKTILNNVYMDLRGKKPVFKRTKTAMERNNIFATIRRYAKKLKPQYNGDVYLETVRCYFNIPQENLEKCRYTYQGNETYAFLMSDKYIMALYTHCLVERKEVATHVMQVEGFTEKEYGMVRLESVGDVLFQAFLFDDVKFQTGNIIGELLTIYVERRRFTNGKEG